MVGLVGCVVLLLRPDLRDLHILILFAGMAGVLPLNRVLDRLLR